MDYKLINSLVEDWDDVYKKGQLTLWILLAVSDGKKYAAQITDFMKNATGGNFGVKEQSLYRALRRFDAMGLMHVTEEQSPSSGPKRKYYELTEQGEVVLGRFIKLHIAPLFDLRVSTLLMNAQSKGQLSE